MSHKQPISTLLRISGKTIADIGKNIEDSQVEDGDPPFQIPGKELLALGKAIKAVEKAMKSLEPEDGDDYGEDHLGERPGHESE